MESGLLFTFRAEAFSKGMANTTFAATIEVCVSQYSETTDV